jgi:hypothetical protein
MDRFHLYIDGARVEAAGGEWFQCKMASWGGLEPTGGSTPSSDLPGLAVSHLGCAVSGISWRAGRC